MTRRFTPAVPVMVALGLGSLLALRHSARPARGADAPADAPAGPTTAPAAGAPVATTPAPTPAPAPEPAPAPAPTPAEAAAAAADANRPQTTHEWYTLAEWGTLQQVTDAVPAGFRINTHDRQGFRFVLRAIENADPSVRAYILARVTDLNARDFKLGGTLLRYAADYHGYDAVQALIAAGADVNGANRDGYSALCAASARGDARTVRLLLANGADVAAVETDGGQTPLHYAARYGHLEVVADLLAFGAPANVADKDGRTPLDLAADRGQKEAVEALLKYGAKSGTEPPA